MIAPQLDLIQNRIETFEGRDVVLSNLTEDLSILGINRNIASEINDLLSHNYPVMFTAINQIPNETEANFETRFKNLENEGRGIYIPLDLANNSNLARKVKGYLKGCFSLYTALKEIKFGEQHQKVLIGHGIESGNMVHDKVEVKGMVTLDPSAIDEYVNGLLMWAAKNSSEINWGGTYKFNQKVIQADALPFGLAVYGNLSSYINLKLQERGLGHLTNTFGGTLSIAPSKKRYPHYEIGTTVQAVDFMNTYNPTDFENFGLAITTQLEQGFIFQKRSMHGQNIYQTEHSGGFFSDHGDLICLSDLDDLNSIYRAIGSSIQNFYLFPKFMNIMGTNRSKMDVAGNQMITFEIISKNDFTLARYIFELANSNNLTDTDILNLGKQVFEKYYTKSWHQIANTRRALKAAVMRRLETVRS